MKPDQYALHEAAKAGNDDRIRALLRDGVDPNQKDKDGRTPLHFAVLSSWPKPTAAYAGTEVDNISVHMSPLLQPAVSPSHTKPSSHTSAPTIKELKGTSRREIHIKRLYSTATSRPISQFGPPKATNSLIEDSDELFGDQAIEAVVPSRTEISLLSDEQPISSPKTYHKDNKGHTRTRPAEQSDSSTCVYSLLQNSTNIDANIQDKDGRTPLHLAAQLNSSNCVYSLLQNSTNIDANIQDKDGRTPLHLAAQLKSSKCVYSLLQNSTNIDANIQDKDGRTPLHLAAQSNSSNCVYSLLQNSTNIDANIQDKDGRTPLHLAAQSNSSNCVYSLLQNSTNIDANIQDKDGRTPLHLAAQLKSSNCVYSLLQDSTNIDANIQDKDGRTPFQTIVFSDWEYLVLQFLERGADPSNIKRWWQSRQDSSREKEVPKYLKLWENAANGFDYQTVDAIVKDILAAEKHSTFGSIVWEWEVPAVFNLSDPARVAKGEAQWLDPKQQVVLVSNETSSDYMKKPTRWVQATTIAGYMAQRWETKWRSFVLGLLDLVQLADLSPKNFGTLFDLRGYPLPL
jgi:ankyrin repeat protein